MRIKFFADRYGIDYFPIPTVAFDYNYSVGSHKNFYLSFRWWVWEAGFSISWHFNLMQNESTKVIRNLKKSKHNI